jgi:hypothetical protein
LGLRSSRTLDWAWLTGVDGQLNYYHVNFANRLLNVASHVDSIKLSANVTNLTGIRGWSTAVVTSNSGGYQAYPIAPRMAFVTSSAKLD